MLSMRQITKPDDIISTWHWFKKHSHIDESAAMVMAKCLAGRYKMLEGLLDNEQISIVTYQMNGTVCIVTTIYSSKHTRKMRDLFFEYLRKHEKATMIEAKSLVKPKVFTRFTTMKPFYTVFRKVL